RLLPGRRSPRRRHHLRLRSGEFRMVSPKLARGVACVSPKFLRQGGSGVGGGAELKGLARLFEGIDEVEADLACEGAGLAEDAEAVQGGGPLLELCQDQG